MRGLLSNSLAPQHSQRPRALVSTRTFAEPLIGLRWRERWPKPQASQQTNKPPPHPRCPSSRWRHSCSSASRSLSRVNPLPVSTRPTIRLAGSAGRYPAPGPGWLLPGKSLAEQFHEHQGLVDVAHAHPLGDGVPEALVGGCDGG
jgi:hypothetical protein